MSQTKIIICLDGRAKVGKGTVCAVLLEKLRQHDARWAFFSTGQYARLIAAQAMAGVDMSDPQVIRDTIVRSTAAQLNDVRLTGHDVGLEAAKFFVGEARIGALNDGLRTLCLNHGRAVLESRVAGTLIFSETIMAKHPDVQLIKLYLDAPFLTRVERAEKMPLNQMTNAQRTQSIERMKARDAAEEAQFGSLILPARDAHIIATERLTPMQVVESMMQWIDQE